MKRSFILGASALLWLAPVAYGQDTATVPPETAPPSAPASPADPTRPSDPSMPGSPPSPPMPVDSGVSGHGTVPATPATPASPAMPADPNAGVPPVPVVNDPNMRPADPAVSRDTTATPGSAANPIVQGGNMMPPPPPPENYPMCTKAIQDQCMQASDMRRSQKRRR